MRSDPPGSSVVHRALSKCQVNGSEGGPSGVFPFLSIPVSVAQIYQPRLAGFLFDSRPDQNLRTDLKRYFINIASRKTHRGAHCATSTRRPGKKQSRSTSDEDPPGDRFPPHTQTRRQAWRVHPVLESVHRRFVDFRRLPRPGTREPGCPAVRGRDQAAGPPSGELSSGQESRWQE